MIHFEFLVVAVDCDSLVHYSDFVMLEFGSAGQVKIEESTQIYLMCYRLISLWFSWFARRQQYFAIFLLSQSRELLLINSWHFEYPI